MAQNKGTKLNGDYDICGNHGLGEYTQFRNKNGGNKPVKLQRKLKMGQNEKSEKYGNRWAINAWGFRKRKHTIHMETHREE